MTSTSCAGGLAVHLPTFKLNASLACLTAQHQLYTTALLLTIHIGRVAELCCTAPCNAISMHVFSSPMLQGGCGVGRSFFHVTNCNNEVGGGFSTDYGVRQQ